MAALNTPTLDMQMLGVLALSLVSLQSTGL